MVIAIVNGLTATKAAQVAGYSRASTQAGGKAAAVRGCRLLKSARIQRAIAELQASQQGRLEEEQQQAKREKREVLRHELITTLTALVEAKPTVRAQRICEL